MTAEEERALVIQYLIRRGDHYLSSSRNPDLEHASVRLHKAGVVLLDEAARISARDHHKDDE